MLLVFVQYLKPPYLYIHIIDIQHVDAFFFPGTNFNLLADKRNIARSRNTPPPRIYDLPSTGRPADNVSGG